MTRREPKSMRREPKSMRREPKSMRREPKSMRREPKSMRLKRHVVYVSPNSLDSLDTTVKKLFVVLMNHSASEE
jgi:hypothetical protein